MRSVPSKRRRLAKKSTASLAATFKAAESQDSATTSSSTAQDKLTHQLDMSGGASVRSRRSSMSSLQSSHGNTTRGMGAAAFEGVKEEPLTSALSTPDAGTTPALALEHKTQLTRETALVAPAVAPAGAPSTSWLSYLHLYKAEQQAASLPEPEMMQLDIPADESPPVGLPLPRPAVSMPLQASNNRSSWYWPFSGHPVEPVDDSHLRSPPLAHTEQQPTPSTFTSVSMTPAVSSASIDAPSSTPDLDAANKGWLSYLYSSGTSAAHATAASAQGLGITAAQTTQAAVQAALPIATPGSSASNSLNPLLEAVPRSGWSSFFASRQTAFPLKSVLDKGASEPKSMEVDFAETQQQLQPPALAQTQEIQSVPSTPSYFGMNKPASRPSSIKEVPTSSTKTPVLDAEPPKASNVALLTSSCLANKKAKALNNKASKETLTPPPNFLLPSFGDTFAQLPRSALPFSSRMSTISKLSTYLFSSGPVASQPGEVPLDEYLPRSLQLLGLSQQKKWKQIKRIVIIGVHGWFPGAAMRTLFGEPTGTSVKFANMQLSAVRKYIADHGLPVEDDAIMSIPLEGEGRVEERVDKLHARLEANAIWLEAIASADAIFVATHSQGCVVSAHLLDRLLKEKRLDGSKCLMLCLAAVSQGPFVHLNGSYLLQPYFNYIENAAARELFEYQSPSSLRFKRYQESLTSILNQHVRVLFCGSLNDQVVPLYSSMFTSFTHPNILRAVFIDGQSFKAVDFASNLVAFALRLKNASLDDHGLLVHLSESLQGALSGVGHSSVYNEASIYTLAIQYLLETEIPQNKKLPAFAMGDNCKVHNPREPVNPYYLPWALRGILEDDLIRKLFSEELSQLREQFEHWQPVSKPLKDVKFRLQAFTLVPRAKPHPLASSSTMSTSQSKL